MLGQAVTVAIARGQLAQHPLDRGKGVADQGVAGVGAGRERVAPDLQHELRAEVLPDADVLEAVPVRAVERVVIGAADVVGHGPADLARCCQSGCFDRHDLGVIVGDRRELGRGCHAAPARDTGRAARRRRRSRRRPCRRTGSRCTRARRSGPDRRAAAPARRPRPASQNVPPSTRKYSSLNSAARYQSGRSGSSRIGRCQASIAARQAGVSARAWRARSSARSPDRPQSRV